MDVSLHPFCGGSHPSDVRITTRYKEDTFLDSVSAEWRLQCGAGS